MFFGGVADFVVEEGLELRKEGIVAGHAVATLAEEGTVAALEVEEFGFIGEFGAKRLVEPVCEGARGVAGVVEAGDAGLAEHGVRICMVVRLIEVVHVCPLLPADIWEANDLFRVQEFFDLVKVGVLVLCVDCYG